MNIYSIAGIVIIIVAGLLLVKNLKQPGHRSEASSNKLPAQKTTAQSTDRKLKLVVAYDYGETLETISDPSNT